MDFIYNLYQNDNFTLYLTIALVVLVILFVLVLFLGKKDQKLEETKRLQKIEMDGFKEEKKEPEKVEVTKADEVTNEEREVKVDEPKEVEDKEVTVTVFEPTTPAAIEPEVSNEDKPLLMETEKDEPAFNLEDINIEQDLKELENIKEEYEDIVLPEDPKEAVLPEIKPVFSSVFVNSKEDINTNNEEVVKSVVEPMENKNVNIFMEDDEDTMELPTLKDIENKMPEKAEESPVLNEEENGFNFDNISDETYDIK